MLPSDGFESSGCTIWGFPSGGADIFPTCIGPDIDKVCQVSKWNSLKWTCRTFPLARPFQPVVAAGGLGKSVGKSACVGPACGSSGEVSCWASPRLLPLPRSMLGRCMPSTLLRVVLAGRPGRGTGPLLGDCCGDPSGVSGIDAGALGGVGTLLVIEEEDARRKKGIEDDEVFRGGSLTLRVGARPVETGVTV